MLPLVLSAVLVLWSLATIALLALCRMAARGDAALRRNSQAPVQPPLVETERWAIEPQRLVWRGTVLRRLAPPLAPKPVATSRGVRRRAGSCAVGS
jgi:hypothetical protein